MNIDGSDKVKSGRDFSLETPMHVRRGSEGYGQSSTEGRWKLLK